VSCALLVLVYATQWLAGRLVLVALDGEPRAASGRLARALLLGPAAITVQMLLMDAAGVRFALPALLLPWWIAGAWVLLRRRAARPGPAAPGGAWHSAALLLALLIFAFTLAGGLAVPVHSSDAMNNFALLARVYQTHGSLAPEAVRALAVPAHVDYPPLVALNEAALFLGTRGDLGLGIKPFFALAQLALLLLVIEACFEALAPRAAALAAAFAMLVPLPAQMAIDGYPDVLLCACVLLLALQGRALLRRPSARGALLYAACAATCALIKFEGLALALAAAPLPWLVARRSRGAAVGEPALLAAPATAAVLLTLLVALAWPLHLAATHLGDAPGLSAAWHDVPRALQRAPAAAWALLQQTWAADNLGQHEWGLFWPACVLAAAVGLLRVRSRRAVAVPASLLLAHLLACVAAIALSPAELDWQVGTAGPRLLLHAAPWALLAALAALAPASAPAHATS
jgi:hypothetical protein